MHMGLYTPDHQEEKEENNCECVAQAVNSLADDVYTMIHELEIAGEWEIVSRFSESIEAKIDAAVKLVG